MEERQQSTYLTNMIAIDIVDAMKDFSLKQQSNQSFAVKAQYFQVQLI